MTELIRQSAIEGERRADFVLVAIVELAAWAIDVEVVLRRLLLVALHSSIRSGPGEGNSNFERYGPDQWLPLLLLDLCWPHLFYVLLRRIFGVLRNGLVQVSCIHMCSSGDLFSIAPPVILDDVEGDRIAWEMVGDALLGSLDVLENDFRW